MASTFQFIEDNGAVIGNPPRGTTRTFNRGEMNWKNSDSSTDAYSSFPITTGNASFTKYQAGLWTGTFNTISSAKFGPHTTGLFGAGLTLVASGTTGYVAPSTTTLAGAPYNVTQPTGIANFSITLVLNQNGPEFAASTTLSTSGYSNYLLTQLQTTSSAAAGDIALISGTLQWDES